jgi:hypothetical protein
MGIKGHPYNLKLRGLTKENHAKKKEKKDSDDRK